MVTKFKTFTRGRVCEGLQPTSNVPVYRAIVCDVYVLHQSGLHYSARLAVVQSDGPQSPEKFLSQRLTLHERQRHADWPFKQAAIE